MFLQKILLVLQESRLFSVNDPCELTNDVNEDV